MNRTNHDCFGVASSGSGGLSERSGWDLRQPDELYFESLAGSRNPFLVHADEFLRARSGSRRARYRPDRIQRLNEPPGVS